MSTAVLAVYAVILLSVGLLMIGLLRSHAEVLRRLELVERSRSTRPSLPVRDSEAPVAHDIVGESINGSVMGLSLLDSEEAYLLAFLSSGCLTCQDFWQSLREKGSQDLPGSVRLLIVTKDRSLESPSRLQELAPQSIPLVMSTEAWDAYEVPAAPYFIYIGARSGLIAGEGSASSWDQVLSLFRDALLDEEFSTKHSFADLGLVARGPVMRGNDNVGLDDETLARSGIHPDHSSLYAAPLSEAGAAPDEE